MVGFWVLGVGYHVIEPDLSESNSSSNKEVERDDENNGTLQLDGGFLLPNNNAFGHSFRSPLFISLFFVFSFVFYMFSLTFTPKH